MKMMMPSQVKKIKKYRGKIPLFHDANIEKELQRKRRQAREDLTQRKNEELAAVVEKARAAIKEIAEDEKYDLILENSVYASPKVDITAKVIKALLWPNYIIIMIL